MTNTTHYNPSTPDAVKTILESLIQSRRRVRVWYGHNNGAAWHEEYDIIGYIGRSTGRQPIPLMVNSARSYGGPALLDDCIVRIDDIHDRRTLYKHPNYSNSMERATVRLGNIPNLFFEVWIDNEVHARFKTQSAARRYIDFMTGARYSK